MQLVICSAGKGEERRCGQEGREEVWVREKKGGVGKGEERRCGQGRQIEEERRVVEVEEVEVMTRR